MLTRKLWAGRWCNSNIWAVFTFDSPYGLALIHGNYKTQQEALNYIKGKEMAKKTKAHPGFKAVAAGMAKKQGIGKAEASAELAAASRGASKKAKKTNPALNKVKGK